MRRLALTAAIALAASLAPAAARAQLTLGARAGYAFGWGSVGGTLGMGDWVSSQVPLQVDALYRVNPRLALGAFFSYGVGQVAGDASVACDEQGADCSARVRRFGVQGSYALEPHGKVEPWIGATIAYEWSSLDGTSALGDVNVEFRGWEYLGLQGGADWRLGGRLAAGPFLHATIGRYGEGDMSGTGRFAGAIPGGSIDDKKLHGWITLGVRARFDL